MHKFLLHTTKKKEGEQGKDPFGYSLLPGQAKGNKSPFLHKKRGGLATDELLEKRKSIIGR